MTVKAAYDGLKYAKDVITGVSALKVETTTIDKINDAVKKVGEAQDTLFNLREELFKLQEENNLLRKQISDQSLWAERINKYELFQTNGGAIVYKAKSGVEHFACPNCFEKKEIQILQDRRVMSGDFDCPGCGKSFPVKPANYAF